MMILELARMLTAETWVIVKDYRTKKTLWTGEARQAVLNDEVKDWDFSKGHIIYI